jgi:tetraacyldisaccharide 4'-kinase
MARRMEDLFERVSSPRPGPFWLDALRGAADCASWLYRLGSGLHHAGYDLGLRRVKRLPAPIISVGNLSVGGTGKTPLTMAVVESLTRLGLPCGIISRGYGRRSKQPVAWVSHGDGPLLEADQAGDEPVMMARRLNVPIAVGNDRHAVGAEMLRLFGPRVLVGDDMFQHRRLHRDLDILAMDAASPLEEGRMLPRGRLREAVSACRRAQAVVLSRADNPHEVRAARAELRMKWGNGPILECTHRLAGLSEAGGNPLSPAEYTGAPVLGFCGLARPDRFAKSLSQLGLRTTGLEPFADHYFFNARDIEGLWKKAKAKGAKALVCSEKDLVRLSNLPKHVNIWVTRLELEFIGGGQGLDALLAWGLKNWTA